jgi:hypothetical protein
MSDQGAGKDDLGFSAPVLRVQPSDVVAFSLGEQSDQGAIDQPDVKSPRSNLRLDRTAPRSVNVLLNVPS